MVEAELAEVAQNGKLNLSRKKGGDEVRYNLSEESQHVKQYERDEVCNENAVFKMVQRISLKERNGDIADGGKHAAGNHYGYP